MPLTPMDPDPNAQTFEQDDELDDEFMLLFGPRPSSRSFKSPKDFQQALAWWRQQYRNFGGIFRDDDDLFDAAATESDAYGLGRPVKYRFANRVHVFWPEVLRLSPLSGSRVDFAVEHLLSGVGQTIARIQSWIIREGHFIANVHPFVPFHLRSVNQGNYQRFLATSLAEE